MRRSNQPRKSGRTEPLSDRRGSADVVSFRSLFRVSAPPFPRPWQGIHAPPPGGPRCGLRGQTGGERLYAGPCRQAGPLWARRVLDRGRHGDSAWHVVGGDRDLFCLSRRRSDAADRPPGGDAIRLRGPDRRVARQGRSHHQPPVARPGTVRPETRPDHAAPDRARIAGDGARRHPRRGRDRIDPAVGAGFRGQ